MKTLLTLSLLLATSTSAFAFTPEQISKVMNAESVKAALDGQNISNIAQGPAYRCMGCYGLVIETSDNQDNTVATYSVQYMDFAGRFHASIAKMEK